MSIDSLKTLLEDFDPASFLPDLNTVFGKIEFILRILVVAGPAVMLLMGLVYFFLSPKEANHNFGYRTWFGMGSVEAWNFTQKLAGLVLGGIGLILTVVMLLIVNRYRLMDIETMLWSAVRCLLWEAGIALVALFGINLTVTILYDWKGYRRGQKPEEPEEEVETAPAREDTIVLSEDTLQIPDTDRSDEEPFAEQIFSQEEQPEDNYEKARFYGEEIPEEPADELRLPPEELFEEIPEELPTSAEELPEMLPQDPTPN